MIKSHSRSKGPRLKDGGIGLGKSKKGRKLRVRNGKRSKKKGSAKRKRSQKEREPNSPLLHFFLNVQKSPFGDIFGSENRRAQRYGGVRTEITKTLEPPGGSRVPMVSVRTLAGGGIELR